MIYLIEGPDGVGKSTLAKEIAHAKGAHIIHSSYNKLWDIEKYHRLIIQQAVEFLKIGIPVVLDRWAVSEFVYSNVFRGGPSYDTFGLLEEYQGFLTPIYCWNDSVEENHAKNKETRIEMFDSMKEVFNEFEDYVNTDSLLRWTRYNFDINDMQEFVKDL